MIVLRTLWLALATLLAGGTCVRAACSGDDLIAALPEAQRMALDAAADSQPYAEGNLWRATKGAMTVTMVGTYHLADPRFDPVMARLEPRIDTARTLMAEAGPVEEDALRRYLALHPDAFTGPSLQLDLSDADWTRLASALTARGVPAAIGAHFKPWYLSALLAMPPCLAVVEAAGNGLDRRIIAYGAARDMPLVALESWQTALHVFDAFSRPEQIEMVRQALDLDDRSEDMMATMTDAYFREDSRRLWEFQRMMAGDLPGADESAVARDYDRLERSLMTERNEAWIPAIEAAAVKGPVFAAFGALHLSGETGVLNLLHDRGWRLERLPF